jgi:hypothetical protein
MSIARTNVISNELDDFSAVWGRAPADDDEMIAVLVPGTSRDTSRGGDLPHQPAFTGNGGEDDVACNRQQ